MQAVSIAASAQSHHRKREQLARAEQSGIAERGDDGGIDAAAGLGQHLQRDRAADLGLGAGRDIRHAARGGRGHELGAG
ncbi:hypothetical protein ACVWW1_001600 [Bradyrhizobium sp. JR3.5]